MGIDWTITVPLQMIEFYLILKAVQPDISTSIFYRLLGGTVWMLISGYLGESSALPAISGLAGWGLILFEIFAGEASKANADTADKYVQQSFGVMRLIVSAGWCIYPLGYFFGYLLGSVNDCTLNLIYNLADFLNKIGFVLAIWQAAKASTLEKEGHLLP